jgi:RimJ/RimL family protein N-acetyltransferase
MEIQGEGFTLRGFKADDVVPLQKHADDPRIYSFLFDRFPHPYTMEAAEAWVASKLGQHPMRNFVIAIDGELKGVIGIDHREDIYRKSPLIGYWLSEEDWGKGIMTQAVKLVTAYAFASFDIVRIQAGVLSNNPGSMRVLEKAGYTLEGILKRNIIKNDIILDEHIYGIVKDDCRTV